MFELINLPLFIRLIDGLHKYRQKLINFYNLPTLHDQEFAIPEISSSTKNK